MRVEVVGDGAGIGWFCVYFEGRVDGLEGFWWVGGECFIILS